MVIRVSTLIAASWLCIGCSSEEGSAERTGRDPSTTADAGGGGGGLNGANPGAANQGASPGASPGTNDGTNDGESTMGDAGAVVRISEATLMIHDTSRLTIGNTLPAFAYKGGENQGTLTDHGDGTATVFFPAVGNEVTPLEVIPGGLGEVQIEPNDMSGEIDFCTGIMTMPFDAQFTPVIFGAPNTKMHVVTDLTTETSVGRDHTLMGKRLRPDGTLKLVGVALVPATADLFVDGLLGLPADAQTNMDGTLIVEGGFPACPADRIDERDELN